MAEAFDDGAEPTVSIDEYIEGMEADELEADLVLGGDDGDECTYTKGYMKRQAIFSCMTCTPNENAGICTACCLSCHDGHEVLELWTKRNFRCDCGNSKFGAFVCKLFPNKEPENKENSYNHNFKGLYCACNGPYPDPEAKEQEEMIQCCACEDWFHERHLGFNSFDGTTTWIPRDEEGEPIYEDFICMACSPTFSFLKFYPKTRWAAVRDPILEAKPDKGEDDLEVKQLESTGGCEKDYCPSSLRKDKERVDADGSPLKSVVGETLEKNTESNGNVCDTCVLELDHVVASSDIDGKPLFLCKTWRDVLCKCGKCLDMYKQKNVSYLLDKEDTIAEYEKRAKQKREENLQKQEGASMRFFNNLDHIAKMEILHGIKDFKEELRVMLGSLGPSKTVTAAHIHEMFDNLKNKRRRTE